MTDSVESVEDRRSLRAFLDEGSEIGGGSVGAVVGLLLGGPAGAVAGAAATPLAARLLRRGAADFADHALRGRERARAAGLVVLAAARIEEKLRQGYEPRHDGFFKGRPGDRSAAEEIAEGTLIAAQREHEERKLPFLANLLANIPFDAEIDRAYANLLVGLAEVLSYRQLCLLALFSRGESLGLRQGDYREAGRTFPNELIVVLSEAADLKSRNLLHSSGDVVFGLTDINPAKTGVQGAGRGLYVLMELWRIGDEDILPLADSFR